MGFIEDLKIRGIKNAKYRDEIHYIVRDSKTRKFLTDPIHCDTLIDFSGTNEIFFICFPHSVISDVVVTDKTKKRFDKAEKDYANYYTKYGRSHKMNWLKYNSENTVEDKV